MEVKHVISFGIRHDDLELSRNYVFADVYPSSGDVLEMSPGHGVTIDSIYWKIVPGLVTMFPEMRSYIREMPPSYYKEQGYK